MFMGFWLKAPGVFRSCTPVCTPCCNASLRPDAASCWVNAGMVGVVEPVLRLGATTAKELRLIEPQALRVIARARVVKC